LPVALADHRSSGSALRGVPPFVTGADLVDLEGDVDLVADGVLVAVLDTTFLLKNAKVCFAGWR
jgi:hypothetical protein